MKSKEVTIYHLIPKLKQSYAVLSTGYFPSQYHGVLAGILGVGVGVAGLYLKLWGSNLLIIPFISEQNRTSDTVQIVAGLQNLGNNCFLNVILQALASSSCFLSFLQNVMASDNTEIEEKTENMPLTVALSSLLEELCVVRDEKVVYNPRRVMVAMGLYVSSFNLTRQQDAAEAFAHLLSSLEEEISECYVLHESSLADITTSPSKIYKPKQGQNECERWKQQFLGPFDGTVGSSLICRSCSTMISLDFEYFRCLPLPPVLDREGEIMGGCTLVECFKHFTTVERVENFRCRSCWHTVALKSLSDKMDKDEEQIQMLSSCVETESCNCKTLFHQDEIIYTDFSCVTKQLSIGHCPRILAIHLQRASMNKHGELIKLRGHISFPLFLDLLPFTQVTMHMGQVTLDGNVRKLEKQENRIVPQLQRINMKQEMHLLPNIYQIFGENLCLGTLKPPMHPANETARAESSRQTSGGCEMETPNLGGPQACSADETGTNEKATNIGGIISLKGYTYRLSSVVEHYGRPGSGHYAVYRRLASETGTGLSMGQSEVVNQQWAYISDGEVSLVSEETVLTAEASLLFYDRIEAHKS